MSGTIATRIGNWRRQVGKRRTHLFVAGRPACGARIGAIGTTSARGAQLADLCYDCLSYGASGRAIR
jgi:hypothetical protein